MDVLEWWLEKDVKIGDELECISGGLCLTSGRKYKVISFDCDGDPEIVNNDGVVEQVYAATGLGNVYRYSNFIHHPTPPRS